MWWAQKHSLYIKGQVFFLICNLDIFIVRLKGLTKYSGDLNSELVPHSHGQNSLLVEWFIIQVRA